MARAESRKRALTLWLGIRAEHGPSETSRRLTGVHWGEPLDFFNRTLEPVLESPVGRQYGAMSGVVHSTTSYGSTWRRRVWADHFYTVTISENETVVLYDGGSW